MHISNKFIQRINQIYNEQNKPKMRPSQKANHEDRVILSTEGKQLQAILQKAQQEPVSEKAEELKAAVASGTYHVKGEDIAASIIKYYRPRV